MLTCNHAHASANRASIRLGANALDLEPVILCVAIIAKKRRRLVHVNNDNVDVPIVVEVAECRSSARARFSYRQAGVGSDINKAPVAEILVHNLSLFKSEVQLLGVYLGEDVAVGHENVRPAVIVEIEEAYTPSQVFRIPAHPGLQDSVVERSVAVVVV